MTQLRPALQRAVLGILIASLIGCPLTFAAAVAPLGSAALAQGPIQFTPNVNPLVTEESPSDFLPQELVLPEAFVEGNVLIINGKPYPIGDGFYDAEGIPLGFRKTDRLGLYGYAPIANLPDHILLWYLDGTGSKRYLVTTANDPLIAGPTGFDQTIQDLRTAQARLQTTVGGGLTGLSILVISQLAGCAPTGGLTCATAVATALVGMIGGTIATLGVIAFDLIPAMNNVERGFTTIDLNRP